MPVDTQTQVLLAHLQQRMQQLETREAALAKRVKQLEERIARLEQLAGIERETPNR